MARILTLQKTYYTKDGRKISRFIKINGRTVPISDEPTPKKSNNNPAFDKAVSDFIDRNPNTTEIYRIDKEGFAFGKKKAGDIFVGTGSLDDWYVQDTPENRKSAESYWETSSFAREIKKEKASRKKKVK